MKRHISILYISLVIFIAGISDGGQFGLGAIGWKYAVSHAQCGVVEEEAGEGVEGGVG